MTSTGKSNLRFLTFKFKLKFKIQKVPFSGT